MLTCSVLNFALPIENEGSEERRQGLSGPRSTIRDILAFALINFVLCMRRWKCFHGRDRRRTSYPEAYHVQFIWSTTFSDACRVLNNTAIFTTWSLHYIHSQTAIALASKKALVLALISTTIFLISFANAVHPLRRVIFSCHW